MLIHELHVNVTDCVNKRSCSTSRYVSVDSQHLDSVNTWTETSVSWCRARGIRGGSRTTRWLHLHTFSPKDFSRHSLNDNTNNTWNVNWLMGNGWRTSLDRKRLRMSSGWEGGTSVIICWGVQWSTKTGNRLSQSLWTITGWNNCLCLGEMRTAGPGQSLSGSGGLLWRTGFVSQ